MIELRNYQNKSISALRENIVKGNKRLILCAPTGAGKTIMFTYMISKAVERGKKCLILTDRTELLTQAGGTLSKFGLKPVEIKPNKKIKSLNGVLFVAMAQTLKRRIKDEMYLNWFNDLDFIIADEAHKQEFNILQEKVNEKTIWIGATATPLRDSNQKSLDTFYNSIIEEVRIQDLIKENFLANPKSYGVKIDLTGIKTKKGDYDTDQLGQMYDDNKLYNGVYENYMSLTPNKKAIIFASNVKSSLKLVSELSIKGLNIRHIDGTTPAKERREILEWFKKTPNALVSNVGILNAGFDEPSIEVVILYRATKSVSLFLQMCGRGSRVTESKKEFYILDFGNNIHRLGFWQDERKWTLKAKKKKEGLAPVKDCPSCSAIVAASIMTCNYCGHVFEKTEKEKEEETIVQLSLLTYSQIKDEIKTADFKKLEMIQKAKGYKVGWLYHQIYTQNQLEEYAKYKGYNHKWVEHQINLRSERK